ncbi:unnamed protein product [Moneuplotes crassus]|uniref:Succinyl-CoA:3-ketoacid-coenzyme A transferase n=2 Tax=Euplotes crassus TaxID=5936 RepID=A0AAD1UF52_EUPCR|nr:unnamed protein product [Moneuplotes crassus]
MFSRSTSLFLKRRLVSNLSMAPSRTMVNKILPSAAEAVKDIPDGATLSVGGFGQCGLPENLIQALEEHGAKDLTCISNNAGVSDFGIGKLMGKRQVKKMISSYVGENQRFKDQYLDGTIELELVPQGTLAEKLRAGGAGIPAFYTPTGVGSAVADGGATIKYKPGTKEAEILSEPKEERIFKGRKYILEESLTADFALVKAWKADKAGNVIFNKSARNFNADCAKAGKICIVEVEEIVEIDSFDPDHVHLPHIYVQRLIKGDNYVKPIEILTYSNPGETGASSSIFQGEAGERRKRIAMKAASLIQDGMYINLGIGIPTLATNFIAPDVHVTFQSENGILGLGEFPPKDKVDADLINAGKQSVSVVPGASFFTSSDSFAMIRGGHVDITFLGGMQVAENGDLANWIIPGSLIKGMGGAMDLVGGAKKVVIMMEHTVKGKELKILKECTLPLTRPQVVDTLITDLATFQWKEGKMILTDIAEVTTVDHVRSVTEASFEVADDLGRY